MNTSLPKVSVIIPTYNRARYICRAINSVLNQTFTDHEIIVVDDGSTDETKGVLVPFNGKIKYIYQNNQGISGARNRGIEEARGEYIAFLDSDDWWAPEKLAEQVKVLDANPKAGIVYSRMPIINEKGEKIGMKPAGATGKNFKELLEIWGDLPTSSVMTRRACFDKVGVFDLSLPPMEDIDMWLRIARFYDLYEIESKTLAYYARHDDQITSDRVKVYGGLVKIYTKILNNFPEAPRDLTTRRIAYNEYLLARTYYNEKFYKVALQHGLAAVRRYPIPGSLFITKTDGLFQKWFKLIKPYGFLVVCFTKACVSNMFGMTRSNYQKDNLYTPRPQNRAIYGADVVRPLEYSAQGTPGFSPGGLHNPGDGKKMVEVSVIVLTYNCGAYIQDAVISVLKQTFQDYEIVVIDDGSTDNTKELLTPYLRDEKIRYFYQKNKGVPGARNTGIRLARGTYILWLDADDELAPTAIQKLVESAKSHNAQWVISDICRVENGIGKVQRAVLPSQNPFMDTLKSMAYFRFYTKEILQNIGMYDEKQKYYEDLELYIRLSAKKPPYSYVDEPLYVYKIRKHSMTKPKQSTKKRNFFYMEQLYKKHHKPLADKGGRAIRNYYAHLMWRLASDYFFKAGSLVGMLRCLSESIRYDHSVLKVYMAKVLGVNK